MKTSAVLITVVVALHVVALGSLFFIQGCGTTRTTSGASAPSVSAPVMPPLEKEPLAQPPAMLPAAKPLPVATPKVETTEYIVRAGDTLSGIAHQYKLSVSELSALNKISDPGKLRVGQKLLLPGIVKIKPAAAKPETTKKAATPTEAKAVVLGAGGEYVVQSGDSLGKIAKKTGTTVAGLREANKLHGDKILIGQKLVIPKTAAAPVPAPAPVAAPVVPADAVPPENMAANESEAPVVVTEAAQPVVSVPTGSGIIHTVQPGDDLNSIAKLYAVTVDEIVVLNQLGANPTVKAGQRLQIP